MTIGGTQRDRAIHNEDVAALNADVPQEKYGSSWKFLH